MDNIYDSTSKLLIPGTRLLEYTELTQDQIDKEGVVLWNKKPLFVDNYVYIQFKEAIGKRTQKHYFQNHILPYPDFCISLLCSTRYSLNHTVTNCISDRAYTDAWRSIQTISATGSKDVKEWINKYLSGRDSAGYCTELGIEQDNSIIFIPSPNNNNGLSNKKDIDVLLGMPSISKIVKITRLDTDDATSTDDNTGTIFESTGTPEGHAADLLLAHCQFNDNFF